MLYSSVNFKPSKYIDISDRGLAFGDGIFTTGKVVEGKLEHYQAHIDRLKNGCLALQLPSPDWQALDDEISKAINGQAFATIKVIISAGNSGRGYSRKGCLKPTIIITVSEFPSHYPQWQQHGVNLGASTVKLGLNPSTAGIKHLNRLEQVLVRNELDTLDFDEVVVCDINNNIVECNTANIFWIKDGILYTPSLNNSGVAGIVREELIKTKLNIKIVSESIKTLDNAEAIFVCNSLLGVVPVVKFMDRKFNIPTILELLGKCK